MKEDVNSNAESSGEDSAAKTKTITLKKSLGDLYTQRIGELEKNLTSCYSILHRWKEIKDSKELLNICIDAHDHLLMAINAFGAIKEYSSLLSEGEKKETVSEE